MILRHTIGYPAAWRAYLAYVNDLPGRPWQDNLHSSLSRFGSRYRAASSMRVDFAIDTNAFRGYSDLLEAAMAYSALEALERALEQDPKISRLRGKRAQQKFLEVKLASDELSCMFRSREATKLRQALQTFLTDDKHRAKLRTLADGGSGIRPLVKGIRHLAFHGLVAPSTIAYGWSDKDTIEGLLVGLKYETLAATDTHFTMWVEEFCRPDGALF